MLSRNKRTFETSFLSHGFARCCGRAVGLPTACLSASKGQASVETSRYSRQLRLEALFLSVPPGCGGRAVGLPAASAGRDLVRTYSKRVQQKLKFRWAGPWSISIAFFFCAVDKLSSSTAVCIDSSKVDSSKVRQAHIYNSDVFHTGSRLVIFVKQFKSLECLMKRTLA